MEGRGPYQKAELVECDEQEKYQGQEKAEEMWKVDVKGIAALLSRCDCMRWGWGDMLAWAMAQHKI